MSDNERLINKSPKTQKLNTHSWSEGDLRNKENTISEFYFIEDKGRTEGITQTIMNVYYSLFYLLFFDIDGFNM